jgi:hypothetical protein
MTGYGMLNQEADNYELSAEGEAGPRARPQQGLINLQLASEETANAGRSSTGLLSCFHPKSPADSAIPFLGRFRAGAFRPALQHAFLN